MVRHDDVDEAMDLIDQMGQDLTEAVSCSVYLNHYGSHPTALRVMQSKGLLAGTSLDSLAMEQFGDVDSDIAVESLLDAIKEKTAVWSAKIVGVFDKVKTSVIDRLVSLSEKIKEKASRLKTEFLKDVDRAKVHVKAHPYETVMICIAAAIAVMGIAAFSIKGLPSIRDIKMLPKFLEQVAKKIASINWPFGKIAAAVTNGGKRIALSMTRKIPRAAVASLAVLGWSTTSVDATTGTMTKFRGGIPELWNNIQDKSKQSIHDALEFGKDRFSGIGRDTMASYFEGEGGSVGMRAIKATALSAISVAMAGVSSVVYVLYHLIKNIVLGTVNLISYTFEALTHQRPEPA